MFLVSEEEGADIVEAQIEDYRDALFILSGVGSLDRIDRIVCGDEFDAKDAETGEAVIRFIEGYRFLFSEESKFVAICFQLMLDPYTVREQIRDETLTALTDGGLDEINLFRLDHPLRSRLLNAE